MLKYILRQTTLLVDRTKDQLINELQKRAIHELREKDKSLKLGMLEAARMHYELAEILIERIIIEKSH